MKPSAPHDRTRRVVIFAAPGAFSLDVLGCFEIFHAAARLLALRNLSPTVDLADPLLFRDYPFAYEVELVSLRAGKLKTMSGAALYASDAITNVRGPVDTLIVAGGDIARMLDALKERSAVKTALRRVAKRARRIASVCTGSFILAALGLLDGRRASTHWAACDLLQARHPSVRVEREPIFTQDGNVYTSAGATTGIDLCLALLREDHGSEVAREVARWLVLYVERSASQPQLSASLRGQAADRKPLRDIQLWIAEHLTDDLSVEALATRIGMSVRNFARAFKRELSVTPAAYVESIRVEVARRKLEMGTSSIEQVAVDVGFGSATTLRRAFTRNGGRSPSSYRTDTTPQRTLRLVAHKADHD